jgi:hypothetical protein
MRNRKQINEHDDSMDHSVFLDDADEFLAIGLVNAGAGALMVADADEADRSGIMKLLVNSGTKKADILRYSLNYWRVQQVVVVPVRAEVYLEDEASKPFALMISTGKSLTSRLAVQGFSQATRSPALLVDENMVTLVIPGRGKAFDRTTTVRFCPPPTAVYDAALRDIFIKSLILHVANQALAQGTARLANRFDAGKDTDVEIDLNWTASVNVSIDW